MSDSTVVCFEHQRFGTIRVPAEKQICCNGLPGFPELRNLLVVEHDQPSCFAWLVCVEVPELALPVTNPLHHYPDYAPRLHHADLRAIGVEEGDPLDLLVIANVTKEGTFLNLAAPLLVNPVERRAIQAILSESEWPVRAPLNAAREVAAPQTESNPHR